MGSQINNSKRVAVIGAGQWGTTLAWLCSKKAESVRVYDHNSQRAAKIEATRKNVQFTGELDLPANIEVCSDLKRVSEDAQILLIAVPSQTMRSMANQLAGYCNPSQYLVHGTKGLEISTRKRMSEVIMEETSCLRVGVLSGPNLADEILSELPAATVVASRYDEVIHAVQQVLNGPKFLVYGNHDIVGVEWIGTLKNVLAVACGLLHELKLGQNAQAFILTRGVAEIQLLLGKLGASSQTLLGLAGLGDIFATSTSIHSRNFRAGTLLAKGRGADDLQNEVHSTVEGLSTIRAVLDLSKTLRLRLPIIEALGRCAFESQDALQEIQTLMSRPPALEQTI